MASYLGPEIARSFCQDMARKIGLVNSLVSIRLGDLQRWSAADQRRFKDWFGTTKVTDKDHVTRGLQRLLACASSLQCNSFLPHTPKTMEQFGCNMPANKPGVVAAVCPLPGVRIIFLERSFFQLREFSFDLDSQISTLIHEIAHLPEVFGTPGMNEVYSFSKARSLALHSADAALNNSDNIAAFVVTQ